ncbi:MAG TPA: DegT/DnrJ/EryC1/StrS family aminotransferase [Solirubrobacteraceae bacterium]|nr:DegT/DnrJ/EryC1/StrS family aminotransferase [Solirubrobacteraceae bacterium]
MTGAATPNGGRAPDPRDPLGLAADAPLLRAYLECLDREGPQERPFHTPGHKGSTALTGAVVAGDRPLAGGVDTVKLRHGWLIQAERRAAALYGADVCRFSVGGSTHCNQAMALSVGAPGDVVVVARTLHRSLLLGLVLAGLEPVWVEPDVDAATGLPVGYSPARVAEALAGRPEAVAVFLSDPSYVGTFSDLAEHARVAHAAGVPLVVDAAWAAHFGFHPDLPPHAMAAGADAMITSAHKTLPAYSQAALLLARTERLDAGRLERAFDAIHTTSPAGTILASIDAARALLEREGERLLSKTIEAVAGARAALKQVPGVRVVEGAGVDAAKLTVSIAGTGAHGVDIEADLIAAGTPVEMADRDTIVALATVADDADSLGRFTTALIEGIERHRGEPRPVTAAAGWIVRPEQRVAPRQAFFGAAETVAFAEAAGRVSAELIALYPPGVPVLAPGELVTAEAQAALTQAAADGVRIAYAADPTLTTLEVLV